MRGFVNVEQALRIDAGIDLSRRQAGMPKQFLDGAEIAAAAEQVRGEGMAQRMRRGGIGRRP